ncbi:MAG: polyphosphate kinase 1 [Pirellulaceae bacterium]|nr:polyphosphate kinase 1 [Pirellulaceae bacterium]
MSRFRDETTKPIRYLNRELSWLEFNQRVLDEASDPELPLLERLKFLAITASNLDEFFMVRVGGLQLLHERRRGKPDPSGLTPRQQLEAIRRRTRQLNHDQYGCFMRDLEPALAAEGIVRVRSEELNERQRRALEAMFAEEISAVLDPLAVTSAEDFPLLVNQRLSLCVRLEPQAGQEAERFAVLPLGTSARRFRTLPAESGYAFILLEDAVALFVSRFFEGVEVRECVPFRITRNADMGVREDQAADLLAGMEEVLDARKQSPCVRLEISSRASPQVRQLLQSCLDVADDKVVEVAGPLDLAAFMQLTDLPGFDHLRYESWPPVPSPQIDQAARMFDVLAEKDVALYHPYDSFEPVVRLIEEAADDPDVLAIKQTLYRTSRNSPVVAALKRAAERGKHVTAIVEVKARFDEARNIEWAKNLEQASVHVIYGVKGLKTHAKVCLIVRQERQGIRRYVHFGTGNYNENTARLYSDVSLMTCNEELGADASRFFHAATGYSQPQEFRKLDAAPLGLRDKLLEMIDAETQRKRHGQKAQIVAKLNSIVDPKLIDALYEASQAGVKIRLNVRGVCCLRPGVPGLSQNISVISIVDRFLEHARILYFYHGGDERVFISSADWMPRNLDRRLELLVPIEEPGIRQRLIGILETCFRDTVKARKLLPDGSYQRVRTGGARKRVRSQEALYQQALDAVRQVEQSRATMLEPHRAPTERD